MAYIGNAKTPLIFAPNTRDDIIPELKQNGQWKNEFLLTQEVPGGYEGNVMVLAHRILSDVLVTNSLDLSIEKIVDATNASGYKTILTTTDPNLAAALNILIPPISFYEGDSIGITSAVAQNNAQKSLVLSKTYDGTSIELELENSDIVAQTGSSLTITRLSYAPWEVLEPEKDYDIISGPNLGETNQIISFAAAPKEGDLVYVIHRGDATYNFVPSAKSVGPDQLQENLRDFLCDRYAVEDVVGQTEFKLGKEAINSKSLLVTVNEQISDGDDGGFTDGDWYLSGDRQSVIFKQPVTQNSKVKILHLGFSTVSRKSDLTSGQLIIPNRSIKTVHIDFNAIVTNRIADFSVTNLKLADDSVTGSKILLNNNEYIRAKNSSGIAKDLLGLTSANLLEIKNVDSGVLVSAATDVTLKAGGSNILTATNSKVGIGTTTPVEMFHISGTAPVIMLTDTTTNADSFISAISNSGSLTISADESGESANTKLKLRVDGADALTITSDRNVGIGTSTPTQKLEVAGTIKATNIETPTINGVVIDNIGLPSGSIIMHGSDLAPSGWLLCDGLLYDGSVATYQKLFQSIGQRYGGSGTFFRVPDLRKRFPIGQSSDLSAGLSDGLLVENRSIAHNHTGPKHTHDIGHSHTIPGHLHEHDSTSSTLNVETSGNHSTDLAHTHAATTTSSSKRLDSLNNVIDYTLSHVHDYTHGHTTNKSGAEFYSGDDSPNHTHTGTTGTDGSHFHALDASGGTPGTTRINRVLRDVVSGSGSISTGKPEGTKDGAHSHSFSTGDPSVKHAHKISINDDTIRNSTTPRSADSAQTNSDGTRKLEDLSHFHNIPAISLPANTNSSSNGAHSHTSSNFSGAIGYADLKKIAAQSASLGTSTITLTSTAQIFVGSILTQIAGSNIIPTLSVVSVSGNVITLNGNVPLAISSGTQLTFKAPSGNEALNTISQNNSSSGPAVYEENTGLSVSPYLVVNFIIKL